MRKHDVDERLILKIGDQGVETIADFVGLEGTEALVRDTLASSFGINDSTVKGKVAIASNRSSEYESWAPLCEVLGPPVELQVFRVSSVHRFSCSLSRRSSGRLRPSRTLLFGRVD